MTAATAVGHAAAGCFDGLVGVCCRRRLLRCLGLLRVLLGAAHADFDRRNQSYDARNDERSFHEDLQYDQRTDANGPPPTLQGVIPTLQP
jgi:hypothetical protein